jgi:hypothetical protein
MNVLIIPEDFRNDQHIVGPIIKRMLSEVGKPNAKVRVCVDPLLGGIGEAKKWANIEEILEMYPMVDLFLLLVDRDGKEGRRQSLDNLEEKAAKKLSVGKTFLAENAWQELEVWAIADQNLLDGWRWQEIRDEIHPKETYFEPLAKSLGLSNHPNGGRKTLGNEAAANYPRVRSRCKEDVEALENKIRQWIDAN